MIHLRRHFNPQEIKLLIFDLDGTLIDSRLDLVHSVNAALRHLSRPELPEDMPKFYAAAFNFSAASSTSSIGPFMD